MMHLDAAEKQGGAWLMGMSNTHGYAWHSKPSDMMFSGSPG
jgi:hypothetical protein